MNISEEQKIALKELRDSLENTISVFNDWKGKLVEAQKYADATECRDFMKELNSFLIKLSNIKGVTSKD